MKKNVYLCKILEKTPETELWDRKSMIDRIKLLMESKEMTQQTFSKYLGISSAALSNIFNGRTKPTMVIFTNIIEKFPNLNPMWLLKGVGPMYLDESATQNPKNETVNPRTVQTELDFQDEPDDMVKTVAGRAKKKAQEGALQMVELKNQDNVKRRVTTITVYYDDNTFETFVPQKQ